MIACLFDFCKVLLPMQCFPNRSPTSPMATAGTSLAILLRGESPKFGDWRATTHACAPAGPTCITAAWKNGDE